LNFIDENDIVGLERPQLLPEEARGPVEPPLRLRIQEINVQTGRKRTKQMGLPRHAGTEKKGGPPELFQLQVAAEDHGNNNNVLMLFMQH
jgi:hypothetical protein